MTKNIKDDFWDTNLEDLPNTLTPKISRVDALRKLIFGEISTTMSPTNQQGVIYNPGILSLRRLAYNQVKWIIHHDLRVPYSYTDIS